MHLLTQATQPPLPFYRLIKLTKGQWALVDEEDYERLNAYKWHAYWDADAQTYYARRSEHIERVNGKQKVRCFSMHREVLKFHPGDPHVDHHNGNGLDNLKSNLRPATRSQNKANGRRYSNNTSGFKGVHKTPYNYLARITVNGKRISLGHRKTAKAASELYVAAAVKYFGEFARLA